MRGKRKEEKEKSKERSEKFRLQVKEKRVDMMEKQRREGGRGKRSKNLLKEKWKKRNICVD